MRLLAEAERLTRERRLERLAIGVLLSNDGAARVYVRFGFRSHSIEMLKALD
jgi:ribosomal protein S18 acetylase RimI-like enzyme